MAQPVTLKAPAKLNLHLHILGKTQTGYHDLDSLTAFVDVSDIITTYPADEFHLDISGPFSHALQNEKAEHNLITKSLQELSSLTGTEYKLHITLKKNIPIGGGLGGGSSDAATILKHIGHELPVEELEKITSKLGSDITACLHAPTPIIMQGTGNVIKPAPKLPHCPILLVNPQKQCDTAKIYQSLAMESYSAPVTWPQEFKTVNDLANFLFDHTRNDLTAPAINAQPVIAEMLGEIQEQDNCLLSRLSGSGATAFGIFATPETAKTAAQKIKTTHPDWWVVESKIF